MPNASLGNEPPHPSDAGVIQLADGQVITLDDAGNPIVEPPPPRCDVRVADINHILSTGQSNSVSNGGTPIISTTQPYDNVMFDVGIMTGGACGDGQGCKSYQTPSSFVPLVEGDQFFNFSVETISAGLANQATFLAQSLGMSHTVLVSLHGRSGNTYWCLRKDGCSYASTGQGYIVPFSEGMRQVADGKRLASAAGKSYVVRGVTTIHGESDHYSHESEFPLDGTAGGRIMNYGEGLMEWQRDYESSVRAITGQAEAVPLFVSQMSGWTDGASSDLTVHQLQAHVNAPGKVILVGPGYPLPFASDCLHYTAHSERWLGEYFAKAYARTVLQCRPFEPLRPLSARRDADGIVIKFLVPVPPLAIDTTRVAAAPDYGFTYADGAAASIAGVEVISATEVRVRLTGAGANGKLRYAQNAVPNATCPGPTQGARGNLRDSDTTPSQGKDASGQPYSLYNWSVHFDLDVP